MSIKKTLEFTPAPAPDPERKMRCKPAANLFAAWLSRQMPGKL
jgi:hypothetical protein